MTTAAPNPKTLLQAAQRMAASAMRDGFQFQALHEFTDAAGQSLHWRIRLKHPGTGEKWIRPMQRFGDGFKPGEPKYPDGKPLYRLHELAARPDDLVIVTEGEFKADKLAALGLLVTTSGAADSAGKTDWQPLSSRAVLIWPDHDEAGRRYAAAVQAALAPLGCTVQKIDVAVLGLETKGDAADWLAAHPDATAADVLALARECLPDLQPQGSDAGSDLQPPALAGASATATKADPNTCKYGGGLFKLTVQGECGQPIRWTDDRVQRWFTVPCRRQRDAGKRSKPLLRGRNSGTSRRRAQSVPRRRFQPIEVPQEILSTFDDGK